MNETEEHAALTELFREHPELAAWLAEVLGGIELPPGHTSHTADPAHKVINLSADALTLVRDANDVTQLAIPVEIQRRNDDDKPFSWPGYLWLERRRQRCKTRLLVVAPAGSSARAQQPIDDGDGNITTPLLVTRHTMPRITDPDEARAHPMRAVLSAAIHAGKPDGHPVARAALLALRRLPLASARRYSRLAFHKMKPNQLQSLREEIMHEPQEQPSEDPNEYANLLKFYLWDAMDERIDRKVEERVARVEAELIARVEAETTARVEAETVARLEAETIARLEAETIQSLAALRDRANVLVHQLDSRGFRLAPDTITRIYGCQDITLLAAWQGRVATANSLAEVFAP